MDDADLPSALARRDWAAALTILRTTGGGLAPQAAQQWRAYVLFRSGDADAALAAYQEAGDGDTRLPQAACLFQLRRYGEAQALAVQAPDCSLRTRLLAHCAAKLGGTGGGGGGEAAEWEAALAHGGIDDRLSLAALLYGRSEFGAAAELYESIQGQARCGL